MKNILLCLVIVLLIITGSLHAQGNEKTFSPGISKDTLLFDDDSPLNLTGKADNCPVKVEYVKGKSRGKRLVQKTVVTCQGPNYLNVEEDGDLQNNDVLAPGSTLTTDDNSYVQLKLLDGSIMRIGPNSTFTLGDCNFTEQSRFTAKDILGEVWSSVVSAIGKDVELTTDWGNAGVRGTKFSLENKMIEKDSALVLRVYEGLVNFRGKFDESEYAQALSDIMKKLSQDYQDGKITADEMNKKVMELNSKQEIDKFNVDVPAGNELVVIKKKTPEGFHPFIPDENTWFSDKNFK